MNNPTQLEYKKELSYDITQKKCAKCGINGTSKRYKLHAHKTRPLYMCVGCINELDGMANALEWAEQNIHYGIKGIYWFEEHPIAWITKDEYGIVEVLCPYNCQNKKNGTKHRHGTGKVEYSKESGYGLRHPHCTNTEGKKDYLIKRRKK